MAIYSNGFQASLNDVEGRISFRLVSPTVDVDGDITGSSIQEVVDVRMSPVIMKKLRDSLTEIIEIEDKKNG